MYRILTINRATTMQNIKFAITGTSNTSGSQTSLNAWMGGNHRKQQAVIYSQFSGTRKDDELLANPKKTCAATAGILSAPAHRSQSTTTSEALEQLRKKRLRKPRYAKYVELLEVTDLTANERKSRVKRLKAKKLQEFIGKSDRQQPVEYQKLNLESLDDSMLIGSVYDDKPFLFLGHEEPTEQFNERILSNPDEVQNIMKSFHNYRDVIETITQGEQEFEEEVFNNEYESYSTDKLRGDTEEFLNPFNSAEPYVDPEATKSLEAIEKRNKTKAATEKAKPRFKSKVHNNEEQERLAKERAIRITLNTYLNVCVSAGMLNRGLSTLVNYRQRAKKGAKFTSSIITIDFYNILLHGFAEKGQFERFHDVFNLIDADGLQFNEQTFAAIFECLGRHEPNEENISRIKKYMAKAEEMGFTLNSIMDRSKFIADQRDIAMDAIRRVHPDFVVAYTPPQLGYDNPLLNQLNDYVVPADAPSTKQRTKRGSEIMNSKRGYKKADLEQMARDQLAIELEGSITIKSIEKTKAFANAEFCRTKLKELEGQWRTQISAAIIRDLNTMKAQVRFKPQGYMTFYTYLKTLDISQFADILINEIYKLAEGSETFSPTVGQLYRELGQKVQQRYQVEQKKNNGTLEAIGEIYSDYCEEWESAVSSDNTRQMWQRLVHEKRHSGPSMDIEEQQWPTNVLTGVGRFLYNILMRDVKIDPNVMRQKSKTKPQQSLPAFYTLFRNHGRLVKEEVKPHPVLARLLRASKQQTLTFDSNLVPMLCPPQPWSTPHNGGYLLNKSDLIRLPHQAIQQWDRINAANPQSIYPALDSLNQLASIPWRVNTDILDVIVEVFQNGGDDKLDVPRPPTALPPLPSIQEQDTTISNEERAKRFKEKMGHRRKQAEMYSLWCDTLYRLSLANHYRDKVFWLPHNMDFRGRVYPVPPHLNHLGSDLARSMLIFDQAQPLGPDGFSWLKLHCINLTGLKKRDSVRERLLYAEDVMDEILDSADNPLTGGMWWTKSDEPWQTLACCIEIAKVYRSPNPEKYMSRFPIHQDGSCNGLQHYAALGRDKSGAFSVNLAPSDVPQDVYSAVAVLVEKARSTDAENGLHVAQALDGFVRRKVIKQTVMTTVYGVTRYGARLQIARQLKDIDDFPKEWVWPASTYLTTKTFESLREMFTSTREIQDWFTECARLISGVCGQNVEWVTPLGLPVVQPYSRQEPKMTARTNAAISESISLDLYERPNVLKQKNAFPPNFIHSLDSSHMMLTSLHCERKGLTFVSVHDCFWTHACTVPELNQICREQFVALHSERILEDLSNFLKDKYSFKQGDFSNDGSSEDLSKRHLNRVLRQLPQKGDFDLNNVLDSIYFFS